MSVAINFRAAWVAARLEANNKNCYTRVCPPGGKDE